VTSDGAGAEKAAPPGADEFERLLLGAERTFTREDISRLSGMSVETEQRIWRALGFADVGEARVFTENDLAVVHQLMRLMRTGALSENDVVAMVRAFGRTTSRLAEWQMDALIEGVEAFEEAGGGYGDPARTAYEYADELLPAFEDMLKLAWRRHLALAGARALDQLSELTQGAPPRVLSVGFADLVSFTRLSRGLSETELAELVDEFEARTGDVVAAHGGRLVKTYGDEVLFMSISPVVATDIGLQLVRVVGVDPVLPDVRVGVTTGAVLNRLGDVYGSTVNLASRITATAGRNELLVDDATAAALASVGGYRLEPQPARKLRGIGEVAAVKVTRLPDDRPSVTSTP